MPQALDCKQPKNSYASKLGHMRLIAASINALAIRADSVKLWQNSSRFTGTGMRFRRLFSRLWSLTRGIESHRLRFSQLKNCVRALSGRKRNASTTSKTDPTWRWQSAQFFTALKIERLPHNPIIRADVNNAAIGDNVNGPSLIRVPDWIPNPLGRYYLYFAHHRGSTIRLAYAQTLDGPWHLYEPGVLGVDHSTCIDHVASPDVHVDHEHKRILMYFHGVTSDQDVTADIHNTAIDSINAAPQRSKLAISVDGLHFEANSEILGPSYFRVFQWQDAYYAIAMPGIVYRSQNGVADFRRGPQILPNNARHHAIIVRADHLLLFFTLVGDTPESILVSRVDLGPDWRNWHATAPQKILAPETEWEGGLLPPIPSRRGMANGARCELRDPAVFREGERYFLLYSVAGEQGIAIARINGL